MRLNEYAPEHRDAVLSAALGDLHPSSGDIHELPLYFQELGQSDGSVFGENHADGRQHFDAEHPLRGSGELFNSPQSRGAYFPMRNYGPFELTPVVPMVFYRSYMPPHCFTMMNASASAKGALAVCETIDCFWSFILHTKQSRPWNVVDKQFCF